MSLKKIAKIFLSLLATAISPAIALAAFIGGPSNLPFHMWPKSLKEPDTLKLSVHEARQAAPEAPVLLRGNITQYVGHDLYVFEDETSSILVSIPPESWRDLEVTSDNLVELHGKLVQSRTYVKIAVARIARLR